MYDMRNAKVFTRNEDGELVVCQLHMNELRMARGFHRKLEELLKRANQGNRWSSSTDSKLFGRMEYQAKYLGRCWWHTLTFVNEPQAFYYEEMRHALQGAIYAVSGQITSLSISMDRKAAQWRLIDGAKMTLTKVTNERGSASMGLSNGT